MIILIDLDKEDLIALVKGFDPTYEQMEHPLCKKNGTFSGSYGRWDWNYDAFKDSSEQELYNFYLYLKRTR